MDGWIKKSVAAIYLAAAFGAASGCNQPQGQGQNQRQGIDRDAERMRIAVNEFLVEARIATMDLAGGSRVKDRDLLSRKLRSIPQSGNPNDKYRRLHLLCSMVMHNVYDMEIAQDAMSIARNGPIDNPREKKAESLIRGVGKQAMNDFRELEGEVKRLGF